MCDHLTVWLWYRLLIVIICLCRGVASLRILSVYILSGQVERTGAQVEVSRLDWESVVRGSSASTGCGDAFQNATPPVVSREERQNPWQNHIFKLKKIHLKKEGNFRLFQNSKTMNRLQGGDLLKLLSFLLNIQTV